MAIRVAIGAGGGRLVRQALVENLVLGVVEDIRHKSVTDSAAQELYRNYAQWTGSGMPMMLAIKTVGRTSAHAATLRALVRQVDPAIDVDAVTPMETLLGATLSQPRLYSVLSAALAALSLTIAAAAIAVREVLRPPASATVRYRLSPVCHPKSAR